jgi:hypothetical protein
MQQHDRFGSSMSIQRCPHPLVEVGYQTSRQVAFGPIPDEAGVAGYNPEPADL